MDNYDKNYQNKIDKYEHVDDLTGALLEKNKVTHEIDQLNESFTTLVRQKIDLDTPKRRINQQLEETKKMIAELRLRNSEEVLHNATVEKGLVTSIKERLKSIFALAEKTEMISEVPSTHLQLLELESKLAHLEDELAGVEINELTTNSFLGPIDGKVTDLKLDKQVLDEKIKNHYDVLKN